jgi:hypothetical protein
VLSYYGCVSLYLWFLTVLNAIINCCMHKTWCRQSGSLEEINNTGGRQTYNFLQKIYTVTTRNPNQSVRNGSKSKPFRSEWLRIQTIPFGMARNPNHGSKSEPFRKTVRCPNVQIPDGSKSETQNGSDGRMVRILGPHGIFQKPSPSPLQVVSCRLGVCYCR